MTLLYLALAYLLGIAIAQFLWQWGLFGCGSRAGMWLLPLALIPVCLWLDARAASTSSVSLRWSAAAGFIAPRTSLSPWLIWALLLAGLTGILRLASHPLIPCWTTTDLAYYNASDRARADVITLRGYITGFPLQQEDQQRLDIQATAISLSDTTWQPLTGRVRLQTRSRYPFRYGEPVQVSGLLTEPPVFEGFDYRAHLARKQIHSLMEHPTVDPLPAPLQGSPLLRTIYALRNRGAQVLNRLLPEPYAALANGMLLGIEAGIPDELYEQFNRTGTSHVIVISGSNVAIIAGVLMALGVKLLGMRLALWPTLAGISLYALLVGGDAAVLRAAFMGGLLVLATVLGRQQTALVSLAIACSAMTLINPLLLWDVGFQLSSIATVGLILFGPSLTDQAIRLWNRIANIFRSTRPHRPPAAFLIPNSFRDLLRDALIMTIAASLSTQPLILYYFGRLSLNPLTNLLIAPVQPLIMLWGSIGLVIGLFGLLAIAQLILYIPYISLWWTVAMVRWGAQLPGSSVVVFGYGMSHLLLTYALLFGWYWHRPIRGFFQKYNPARFQEKLVALRPQNESPRLASVQLPASILGGLGVIAFLLWRVALSQPDGKLHVYFLDIGQGDGIFIQMPSGQQVLIDGGSTPAHLMAELSEVMPFWDRTIDLAIVTHPDWDHMGAQLELPERYALKQAFISEAVHDHPDTRPWLEALQAANVPVEGLRQGGWLDVGDGVALWALWPPGAALEDKNEGSLVMKLVYGEFSVLLTGDIGRDSEAHLLEMGQPLAAQVLKVGHHGSDSSSSDAFLEAVGANVAVIQVGMNRYGHPHMQVLESLQGHQLLRNDQHGRIHIWSDGQSMWLETEQGEDEG